MKYTVVVYYDVWPILSYEFKDELLAEEKYRELVEHYGYDDVAIFTEEVKVKA